MKKSLINVVLILMAVLMISGCEKEEEKAPATETYVEENEIQLISHDTEDIDFRIAVIEGEMTAGFERLMQDAQKGEAANVYRFYKYEDLSKFETFLKGGMMEIATVSLEDALELNEENPGMFAVLSINAESEDGYGVTIVNTGFAKGYPAALKVFMEEMKYSAKDAVCVTGEEMKATIEAYLTEQEMELPEDEFYYPLPVQEEALETQEND